MCDQLYCSSKRAILVHFPNVGQATNQVSNQVHPCDHSLLRELFQPGRDIRQVVIRARWHLLLYMSSLFCCSFWILPFIQNKTSLTVILSLSNQNDRDCVFYPSTMLIFYLQKVRSPRKSTTCWLYGQSSSLPFHSHFIVLHTLSLHWFFCSFYSHFVHTLHQSSCSRL